MKNNLGSSAESNRLAWLKNFSRGLSPSEDARKLNAVDAMLSNGPLGERIRESFSKAKATYTAQQESGAGFLADVTLREFQLEYQSRLLNMGGQSMPTSFQIAEAFFGRRSGIDGFFLLPEKDFLISFEDFLDYVTSGSAPSSDTDYAYNLENNYIYNVTSTDALGSLLLETRSDSSYSVRAFSMVRRNDELIVSLSLGERLPEKRVAEMEVDIDSGRYKNPHKPGIDERLANAAAPRLVRINQTDFLPTIALIRFNLKHRKMNGRCLLRDVGDSFRTWTDITAAFAGVVDESDAAFRSMLDELDNSEAIWEVGKSITLLPSYLAARISSVSNDKQKTRLGAKIQTSLRARREFSSIAGSDRVIFRTISAIAYTTSRTLLNEASVRSFTPPTFQVHVEGFWRVLHRQDAVGRDELGAEVVGKTWVKPHLRYKDNPVSLERKVVFIKKSLSEAREKLARYRQQRKDLTPNDAIGRLESILPATGTSPLNSTSRYPGPGAFVYVMRCSAHTDDLYKVGFTDRDPAIRARELSASTASPTPFTVLYAWPVSDGRSAEKVANVALQRIRLSASREFFQVPLAQLLDAVGKAIVQWAL